jgi:hypothetical protein
VRGRAYAIGSANAAAESHSFWRVKRGTMDSAIAESYNVWEPFGVYRINRRGLRRMYARASAE